jgi:hypothetical protein
LLISIPNKPQEQQPIMQEKSLSTDVPLFLQNNKVLFVNSKNGTKKRINKMSKK